MRTIVIANKKGGVGKTTTTQNLGAGLARLGLKVLLIDCDHQANLTTGSGVIVGEGQPTLIDVLRGLVGWKDAAVEVEANPDGAGGCVYLVPATSQLAAMSIVFGQEVGKEMILRDLLATLPAIFDVILLDSPPSLDLVAINALVAATDVIIPVQCEAYALQGTRQLLIDIQGATKRLNPNLQILGVVATMYDRRKTLAKDVHQALESGFPDKIFTTTIRDVVALAEAPSHGQTIFVYDAKSYGTEDYLGLGKEVKQRLTLQAQE